MEMGDSRYRYTESLRGQHPAHQHKLQILDDWACLHGTGKNETGCQGQFAVDMKEFLVQRKSAW